MSWLLALGLSAEAATFGERGGVSLSSSAALQPWPPVYGQRTAAVRPLGCLGVEAVLLYPDPPRRPNHRRVVAAVQGCGDQDWSTKEVAAGLGIGGQWGGRQGFVSVSMIGGLASMEERHGQRSLQQLGPWVRPRAAVGVQLGPSFALELGPSVQGFFPLLTQIEGPPPEGRLHGTVGLDLVLTAGSIAPRASLGAGVEG